MLNRRGLITASMAAAAAPFVRSVSAKSPAVPPDDALRRLRDGNARYVANTPVNTDHSVGRSARALGQQPFAAIVSCADSRVAPELIFDQGPGELFVIRAAGNVISDYGLASLEYGTTVLGISTILVLGHSSCGAVEATISAIRDETMPGGHLPGLVKAIRPAVQQAMREDPPDLLAAATARNAQLGAEKAQRADPILSELSKTGDLTARAAVYDIATGKVEFL
ncbi:hypothetical protein M3P21_12680 [Ruegeria sp. 2012CJ41-6]|uniref:carbonic anhydrase n=1 Tax=Ruegeria spongiae TaxID=2942209 RepID=A0ABT0Q3C6_9RHOB|nr:carbonic anhydrase [Ruegeria spongiae]MCL6284381.1 hypothetical protein [Ruegeria spongiae]